MSKLKNPDVYPNDHNLPGERNGISLLDHFAGIAMGSMITSEYFTNMFSGQNPADGIALVRAIATNAYGAAAIMLQEREKALASIKKNNEENEKKEGGNGLG